MGAWGYAYTENDDYYDRSADYVKAVVTVFEQTLRRAKHGRHSDGSHAGKGASVYLAGGSIRAQLMTVYTMVSALHKASLSREELDVLRDAEKFVRDRLRAASQDWSDPDEFMSTATAELDAVEAWLDSFNTDASFAENLLARHL